jgi:hypothetical protein
MIERLAKFTERKGPDECWRWTGFIDPQYGYGRVKICVEKVHKTRQAHRLVYEIHKGPIPIGYDVAHSCHHRWCVNPNHLAAATRLENINQTIAVNGHVQTWHYGTDSPHTKLTIRQVRAIRAFKGRAVDIAAKYGISTSTVNRIRRGQSWKRDNGIVQIRHR